MNGNFLWNEAKHQEHQRRLRAKWRAQLPESNKKGLTPPAPKEEIVALYSRMTLREISAHYHIGYNRMSRIMNVLGIPKKINGLPRAA